MHQGILPGIEQAADVADEHELAERRDDQRERRQYDDDQEIDDTEAEGEPAPAPEIQAARAERLAGDGGVAAAAQHLLLQEHEQTCDDHQDDRNRCGCVVKRRRPVGELENVSREHADIGRRAEHRWNAVDAEHHDE